jgi:putative copper resistance protein D
MNYIYYPYSYIWLGGMLFLILAFIPGIKNHADKVNLIAQVSLKFRKVGIIALLILLVTGIVQLEYRGVQWTWEYFTETPFGKVAGLKILVFIAIVTISLVHDHYLGTRAIEAWKNRPGHPKTVQLRNLSRILGRVSFILALLAVLLGALLVRGW